MKAILVNTDKLKQLDWDRLGWGGGGGGGEGVGEGCWKEKYSFIL